MSVIDIKKIREALPLITKLSGFAPDPRDIAEVETICNFGRPYHGALWFYSSPPGVDTEARVKLDTGGKTYVTMSYFRGTLEEIQRQIRLAEAATLFAALLEEAVTKKEEG